MPYAQLVELVIWSEERIPKAFLPNLKSKPKELLVSSSVCFSQLIPQKTKKMVMISGQLAGDVHRGLRDSA